LFNWPIFGSYSRSGQKANQLAFVQQVFMARCPSCHTTDSVKATKGNKHEREGISDKNSVYCYCHTHHMPHDAS